LRKEEHHVSKRHTASRRRSYGRRQHELHERIDQRAERSPGERAWRTGDELSSEPIGYLEGRAPGQRFGFID
jgi:hypothetical protein